MVRQYVLTVITRTILTLALPMATTALVGSPVASLLARAPGTTGMVPIMGDGAEAGTEPVMDTAIIRDGMDTATRPIEADTATDTAMHLIEGDTVTGTATPLQAREWVDIAADLASVAEVASTAGVAASMVVEVSTEVVDSMAAVDIAN